MSERPSLESIALAEWEKVKQTRIDPKALIRSLERERYTAARRIIENSPLSEWFPGVEWNIEDIPPYPFNAYVVFDKWDTAPRKERTFLMVQNQLGAFQISLATPDDSVVGYRSWNIVRLSDPAALGEILSIRRSLRAAASG